MGQVVTLGLVVNSLVNQRQNRFTPPDSAQNVNLSIIHQAGAQVAVSSQTQAVAAAAELVAKGRNDADLAGGTGDLVLLGWPAAS